VLSVTNKPFVLSVVKLDVNMLSVVDNWDGMEPVRNLSFECQGILKGEVSLYH
jgi:hypothetical protein